MCGWLARWRKWRASDVGEAKEGLENELWRRWSNGRVGAHSPTLLSLLYVTGFSLTSPSEPPMGMGPRMFSFSDSKSDIILIVLVVTRRKKTEKSVGQELVGKAFDFRTWRTAPRIHWRPGWLLQFFANEWTTVSPVSSSFFICIYVTFHRKILWTVGITVWTPSIPDHYCLSKTEVILRNITLTRTNSHWHRLNFLKGLQ